MHSEASSFTAHLLRGQRQAPEPKQSKRWGEKGLGVVLKIARPCVSTSHSPTVRGHRGWGTLNRGRAQISEMVLV